MAQLPASNHIGCSGRAVNGPPQRNARASGCGGPLTSGGARSSAGFRLMPCIVAMAIFALPTCDTLQTCNSTSLPPHPLPSTCSIGCSRLTQVCAVLSQSLWPLQVGPCKCGCRGAAAGGGPAGQACKQRPLGCWLLAATALTAPCGRPPRACSHATDG